MILSGGKEMKKTAFIFSCLFIVLGIITMIITSILNEVIPKLGYVAFQAAARGEYSPTSYKMNFSFANFLASVMIIAGIIGIINIFIHVHRNKADS